VEAAEALAELAELSSQVEHALVLRADGSVLAATPEASSPEVLANAALELIAVAFELRSTPDEVTRVEVELERGGVFVLRDGGRTIAATKSPGATPGLVVYDLRTCLHAIDEGKPKRPSKSEETGA
jgi:predicted regulator of Ras-like GTPase activity (Roadblock/LC7/MglB family)